MKMGILYVLLVLGAAACVSSGKYRALQSEKSSCDETLKSCEAKNQEKDILNAGLQARLGSTSKDKNQLELSVQEMKTALAELTKRKQDAENRIKEYRDLLGRFQSLIDSGKLSVKMVDGRMVVALATDVLFGSGSSQLNSDGRKSVQEVGAVLAGIAGRKFQVEGHTDNVPIRTSEFASNWELASARAISVVKAMIESGLKADRISAASFSDTRPVQTNETREGRALNRRIEIVVVPDLSALPGNEELKKYAN